MQFVRALLLVSLFAMPAEAQKRKSKCEGSPPDSIELAGGLVYRDCEVDRPAKVRGGQPRIAFSPRTSGIPRSRCYVAEFQLVVDTLGNVELPTVRPHATNDPDLESAIVAEWSHLRFEPAQLAHVPVRQIVVYRREVGVMVRLTSERVSSRPGSSAPPPPPSISTRPPRC
jgi:hypothetical protein